MKLFLTFLAAFLALAAHAEQWQSATSIESAALTYAKARGGKTGAHQKLQAGPLDERMQVAQCPDELTTAFAPGVKTATRMTVEVRCPGPQGWKVYVPVTVNAFARAAVVTRDIDRGQSLAPADIKLVQSDVSVLPAGYFSELGGLNGVTVSRPIVAGTVLTSSLLNIEPLVRRGEEVTAVAKTGSFAIRTKAIALAAAGLDQRVKLKNSATGKELEGVVRGQGLVEVAVR